LHRRYVHLLAGLRAGPPHGRVHTAPGLQPRAAQLRRLLRPGRHDHKPDAAGYERPEPDVRSGPRVTASPPRPAFVLVPFTLTGDPAPDANTISGAIACASGVSNVPITLTRQRGAAPALSVDAGSTMGRGDGINW